MSDDEEEVVDKQNAEDTKNKGKSSYVKKDNDNNIVIHSQNNYKKHDFDSNIKKKIKVLTQIIIFY